MATATFDLHALAAALDHVSDEIKAHVGRLPGEAADRTIARARATYPVGPAHTGRTFSKRTGWGPIQDLGGGTLRDSVGRGTPRGVSVTAAGGYVPIAIARVLAPHVHFWEKGTRERFDPTRRNPKTGLGAARGRAKEHHPWFVEIAVEARAAMMREAEQLVDVSREIG